jgi:hypothetical protein
MARVLRSVLAALACLLLLAQPAAAGQKGPGFGGGSISISGAPTVGQVLSVPAISGATYQWQRNGSNIAGATSRTYTTVTADGGTTVAVRVTVAGVSVTASLAISGTPVTTATQNSAYTGFSVSGSGGSSPYAYSLASGAFPTGIGINSSSGAVSGTPTVAGTFAGIVLRVTDSLSATADLASFTITVSAPSTGGQFDFSQGANSGLLVFF